jgi:hypothetical protein
MRGILECGGAGRRFDLSHRVALPDPILRGCPFGYSSEQR